MFNNCNCIYIYCPLERRKRRACVCCTTHLQVQLAVPYECKGNDAFRTGNVDICIYQLPRGRYPKIWLFFSFNVVSNRSPAERSLEVFAKIFSNLWHCQMAYKLACPCDLWCYLRLHVMAMTLATVYYSTCGAIGWHCQLAMPTL